MLTVWRVRSRSPGRGCRDCARACARSWTSTSTRTSLRSTARTTTPTAVEALRARAKEQGLWAPHVGPEAGGTGRGFLAYALPERGDRPQRCGRSSSSAARRPTPATRRSCTCSGRTSRASAGCGRSSPARCARSSRCPSPMCPARPDRPAHARGARRRRVGDRRAQVVQLGRGGRGLRDRDGGHRPGRAAAPARESQILVPADTPGFEVVRAIPVLGHRGRGWTTHCEVRYTRRPRAGANVLGEPGDGFRIAQKRLGPGRIHHVMRWLGQMQRAFELMCRRALEREAFGVAARGQADDPELDRRLRGGDPGVPPADARRGAQDRRRRRGARRDLGDQVLRRARPQRRDRPGGAGARRPRAHGRLPLPSMYAHGARRAHLRRPGRGAPHGRHPPHPEGVRGGQRLAFS